MSRRRRVFAVVFVAVVIISLGAPVSADPWVGGTNTSFQTFNLDSGSAENLTSENNELHLPEILNGTTIERGSGRISVTSSQKAGIEINPNRNIDGVNFETGEETENYTTVYLLDSNENILTQKSVSDGSGDIFYQMSEGESYYLVVDAGGDDYGIGGEDMLYEPKSYDDLDVLSGYGPDAAGGISGEDVWYAFGSVTAFEEPETASYQSASIDLEQPQEGAANIGINNGEAVIDWQGQDGSGWTTVETSTVTSGGEHTADLTGEPYDEWRVSVEFAADDGVNSWDAQINEAGIQFSNTAPTISSPNPEDGAFVESPSADLEVDVTDPEFGAAQGDSVDVTFYDASDDSQIGADTLSSNGTASATWSNPMMGTNDWYAVAEDDYGGSTQTETISFDTPSELRIYNESDPDQLIQDDVDVEVTFFGSEETVETRTVSSGTVNLTGLPMNEEYTVQLEADGYITRQTVIQSLVDQQAAYLLPENSETVTTRFQLDDPTGQFDQDTTRILIKKPIDRDNHTAYETVVGDIFGTGEFSTVLERDQRYLIEVEDLESGERRELGPYVATTSENVLLEVDQLDYSFDNEEIGYQWNATYVNETDPAIDFAFAADNGFEDLSLEITESRSGDVIYSNTWISGDAEQTRAIIPESVENPNETTYTVEWSATVTDDEGNSQTVSGAVTIGPDGMEIGVGGVGDRVLALVSILVVLLVAGLFSAVNVGIGGVVTSLVAGLCWFAGFLPGTVSGITIALALLLSVLWMARNARGPQ